MPSIAHPSRCCITTFGYASQTQRFEGRLRLAQTSPNENISPKEAAMQNRLLSTNLEKLALFCEQNMRSALRPATYRNSCSTFPLSTRTRRQQHQCTVDVFLGGVQTNRLCAKQTTADKMGFPAPRLGTLRVRLFLLGLQGVRRFGLLRVGALRR